jgi:hypothetical protein
MESCIYSIACRFKKDFNKIAGRNPEGYDSAISHDSAVDSADDVKDHKAAVQLTKAAVN